MKLFKLLVLGFLVLSITSCEREIFIGCLKAEGDVETREFDFGTFDELSIGLSSNVTLTQSNRNLVTITAAANVLDRLDEDSEVSGSSLSLEINGCTKLDRADVSMIVEMKDIRALTISGDANLESDGVLSDLDFLDVRISGSGDMTLEFDELDRLTNSITGDGNVELKGTVIKHDIFVTGSGTIRAKNLIVNESNIRSTGDARVYAYILDKLDFRSSGSSFLEVEGTASLQNLDISGDSEVKNLALISEKTIIDLSGSGKCEVFANTELDVTISGDGEVCYKGTAVLTSDISGNGQISNCN